MHLSGQLSDWSIHDLLQIMQVTKKTGSLDIDGQRRGRIHFRSGSLTGAELTGSKGSYVGTDRGAIADILYVLSSLDNGSFSVGQADGPETTGWSVEDVLHDVDSLKVLEGEVIDAGLFEAAGIRLNPSISSAISIDPGDWAVMVSLVQPFSFNYLEAKMGRGGAVRVFHTLHRLGVVSKIHSEDAESEWLDQLADEITLETPAPVEKVWIETKSAEADTPDPVVEVAPETPQVEEAMLGVSAPASTTLTDGVYDEIRRLRSKVSDR
jgi:hypothetical protein